MNTQKETKYTQFSIISGVVITLKIVGLKVNSVPKLTQDLNLLQFVL